MPVAGFSAGSCNGGTGGAPPPGADRADCAVLHTLLRPVVRPVAMRPLADPAPARDPTPAPPLREL